MLAWSPVMYQPFLKRELYISSCCQYVYIIDGQPGRTARLPALPGAISLNWSSRTPMVMPGNGRPIEPGRTAIDG